MNVALREQISQKIGSDRVHVKSCNCMSHCVLDVHLIVMDYLFFKTPDGCGCRPPEKALGNFEIQLIAVSGKIVSDKGLTSISTNVILRDTILDDTRVVTQSSAIKR